ncbi:hypothetical protein D7Z54_26865 [Salibacterium salarium]|uniref:Uncharacterized protein n=1 Tax=Salibacterium salarium TaxID=284579 RepID=A0A428MVW7_9BACI|nr:hypothetical protein [Salibacterium salarium]RSL30234.1 hypothetical protein D7Z54_26865 [Salibacterium salarium]
MNSTTKMADKERCGLDPLTIIILIVMIIFLFPLIMRGVGCILRIVALAVLIIGALILLSLLL